MKKKSLLHDEEYVEDISEYDTDRSQWQMHDKYSLLPQQFTSFHTSSLHNPQHSTGTSDN